MTALLLWAGAGSAWAFDVCVNGTPVETVCEAGFEGRQGHAAPKVFGAAPGPRGSLQALRGPWFVSGGRRPGELVIVANTCELS